MTLWQRIFQGVTAFWVETIINLVAGILGARLVFHYLPPADYGRLALFLSFYATGTMFLGFGLGSVFTTEIARARGTGKRGWARFLISRYLVLLLAAATLLLFLFAGIGGWRGEPLLWNIMGAYLWLTAPNRAAYVLLHGATRYRRLASQSITRNLSRLALLATLPRWWPGESLTGVALTYPLTELAAMMVSLALVRVIWPEMRGVSTVGYSYKDLLVIFQRQGLYATLSIPVKKIGDQLPVWLLKALAGDVELGIYAAAQRAYLLVFAFFRSLETTLFPLIAEQIEVDKERLRVALRQTQKYSFWLGVASALFGTLVAPRGIQVLAGEQYRPAISVFRLMLWLLVLYAFSQAHRPLFYALRQQKWLFATYVLSTTTYAVMLFGGIAIGGVTGAVGVLLVHGVLFATLRWLIVRRLDASLWIAPGSVLRLDDFDKRLWRKVIHHIRQRL